MLAGASVRALARSRRAVRATPRARTFHAVANSLMEPAVTVHSVPVLRDNYSYILRDEANCECWVVDPGEAEPVLRAVGDSDLELRGILNTHWHPDHVGGNEGILRHSRDLEVVGPRQEASKIPGITTSVAAGETVALGALTARVLACGAHTSGHVMFHFPAPDGDDSDDARPLLFSGDTLFVAGCGRFFEGDAGDMMALVEALRRGDLPPSTRVYCGHEYTTANAKFALHVEPGNEAVQHLADRTQRLREQGRPTVPSTIGEELRHNPFLRVHEAAVQEAMGTVGDPLATLTRLRQAKDAF